MRWLGLLLLGFSAIAEARPRHTVRTPPPAPEIWERAIDPGGIVAHALVEKAHETITRPERGIDDWAVDQRARYYRDAYNILREARRLSPNNVEVLGMFGQVADELGKTREAIEALEAAVGIDGPDRVGADITGRLGALELRLGHTDAAIRWLRYAQAHASSMDNIQWTVYLATALALRGEIIAATDALDRATPASIAYFNPEASMVAFSLAVLYDRDEQRSSAFNVLDRMQGNLGSMYATQLQHHLLGFDFIPGEDRNYYLGLFYESIGEYVEARAAWSLYAASGGDSPWRARALDHIAAIDTQRRANPTIKPTQIKPPK